MSDDERTAELEGKLREVFSMLEKAALIVRHDREFVHDAEKWADWLCRNSEFRPDDED